MKEKIKKEQDNTSFSQTKEKKKWWQYRKISRKEAGRAALLGLLGFMVCHLFLGEGLIADIFGLIFWIGGIIWIVKSIQLKVKTNKFKKGEKEMGDKEN